MKTPLRKISNLFQKDVNTSAWEKRKKTFLKHRLGVDSWEITYDDDNTINETERVNRK